MQSTKSVGSARVKSSSVGTSEGEDRGAEDDEGDNDDDGQQIYEDMSTP